MIDGGSSDNTVDVAKCAALYVTGCCGCSQARMSHLILVIVFRRGDGRIAVIACPQRCDTNHTTNTACNRVVVRVGCRLMLDGYVRVTLGVVTVGQWTPTNAGGDHPVIGMDHDVGFSDDARQDLIDLSCWRWESLNWILCGITTPLIARMDSDDVSFPNRLELQVNYLAQNPNVAAVGGSVYVVSATESEALSPSDASGGRLVTYPTNPGVVMWEMLHHCAIAHPTVMMRSILVHKLAGRSSPLYFGA